MLLLGLVLSLSSYHGPHLRGSIPDTVKFGVHVTGRPNEAIDLRAVGTPKGWIASFCTDRICAPFRVRFALPPSGSDTIEMQLVPPSPGAAAPHIVTVRAAGGEHAAIRYSEGSRDGRN